MKKTITSLLIVAVLTTVVFVQTTKAAAVRYFLMPIEVVVVDGTTYRGPQHLEWKQDPDPQNSVGCLWSLKDYGAVNTAVVAVDCPSQAEIDTLSAKADVFTISASLDTQMSPAERSAMTAYLDANFVPSQWLASDTWRQATRTITGMYLFQQCTSAIAGDPFSSGLSLNTQFRNLPAIWQTAINGCYATLGYTVNYSANTTLRSLLKGAADQWGTRPILFGFTSL